MAAGAAEASAARDDGAAHYAANAGVSQDCSRCIHAIAGREAALADGDSEIPETAGASAPSATTASAEAWKGCQGGCGRGPGGPGACSGCRQEEREGRNRCAAAIARSEGRGCEGPQSAEGREAQVV